MLLLFALLDSGVLPVLDSLLPANILLLGSLALFAGCVLLSLDVLKEGLVQLTNLAPNGDTPGPVCRPVHPGGRCHHGLYPPAGERHPLLLPLRPGADLSSAGALL